MPRFAWVLKRRQLRIAGIMVAVEWTPDLPANPIRQ